jgi:hypothetical protein
VIALTIRPLAGIIARSPSRVMVKNVPLRLLREAAHENAQRSPY